MAPRPSSLHDRFWPNPRPGPFGPSRSRRTVEFVRFSTRRTSSDCPRESHRGCRCKRPGSQSVDEENLRRQNDRSVDRRAAKSALRVGCQPKTSISVPRNEMERSPRMVRRATGFDPCDGPNPSRNLHLQRFKNLLADRRDRSDQQCADDPKFLGDAAKQNAGRCRTQRCTPLGTHPESQTR